MKILLHRKVTICMVFIGLTMLGYISYRELPVELLPNAELPMLFVQVGSATQVSPEYLEQYGVIPVEGAIGTLEGIEKIESQVDARQAVIRVSFKQNVEFKYAFLKLQQKIDAVKPQLPEDLFVAVAKIDLQQLTNQFMDLQIRGSGGTDRLRNIAEREIKPALENVDGLSFVNVFGGRRKNLEILLDKAAGEQYNITPSLIQSKLSQNSGSRSLAGYLYEGDRRFFIRTASQFSDIRDIETVVLAPGPVLLRDVAKISFGVEEESTISRVNGKDAISMTISKDAQANIIDLSRRCLDLIDDLNERLAPKDVQLVVQRNIAETMENNIQEIIDLALKGGLLAVFVLWIFLKDLRLISVIAVSIPVSVFAAFNFFYGAGISVNSLTLVGMALAVGMLLDNSIVVLENIYRLKSSGQSSEVAVTEGVSGVGKAILAATLTTATVFVPFLFSDNFLISLIGKNIGVSIISTLLVSLFAALLLIPVLGYLVLRLYRRETEVKFWRNKVKTRAESLYLVLLKSSLRHPARTIIGALLLFFIVAFSILALSVNDLQEIETDQIDVFVTMAKGSTLENTDKVVREVEAKVMELAERQDVSSKIRAEDAVITVRLKEKFEEIDNRSFPEIKADIGRMTRRIGGGARISLFQSGSSEQSGGAMGGFNALGQLMGFGDNQERILIKGNDYTLMQRVAQDLLFYIESLGETNNAGLSTRGNRPEVSIAFDPLTMARRDITLEGVGRALRSFGQDAPSSSRFAFAQEDYEIIIRENDAGKLSYEPRSMDELRQLKVSDQSGGQHPLESFSRIRTGRSLADIRRVNQQKEIELSFRVSNELRQSPEAYRIYKETLKLLIAGYPAPGGIAMELVELEDQYREFKWLGAAALILIFMILASVFESLSAPFVLLFAVPLAGTGAMAALMITGNGLLNANTLTGFLILLGVIVNNGIILIDYVNSLRRSGYRRSRAIITAGLHRLRPILITAVTTIVAMFPLALGTAEYVTVIGAPFAITVIGGLALGTFLTLILIPTLYLALENCIEWFAALSWPVKALNLALIAGGTVLVYLRVNTFLWQIADILLIFLLVPAVTYFVQMSLKRAQTRLIPAGEELHIQIQSLVKIYNRSNRFSREMKGNRLLDEMRKEGLAGISWLRLLRELLWQIPLLVFMSWFTFEFLESGFWMTAVAVLIYWLVNEIWRPFAGVRGIVRSRLAKALFGLTTWVVTWLTPLLLILILSQNWDNPGYAVFIGIVWYLFLAISSTSRHIYRHQIKIERVKWSLRRIYYRLIMSIPLIGRRKVPFKALSSVTLDIKPGMYGLLGPNGAGKSTLMRIISGIFEQSYGKVWINGFDTQRYREELQGLIGYLPQAFGSYENMSAWNYLEYQAILKGLTDHRERQERLQQVLSSVNMLDRRNEKIGSFSGGMKQRIGIAQILLHLPRILVVDEPTAGLDPRERIRFRNLLVELSRERIVIFSTHIIEDIASSCNQLAVINKGEVKYQGSPQEMVRLADGLVWEYLVPAEDFHQAENGQIVVNHLREGEQIRVRCIAREKPHATATETIPILEDAYLCLLKDIHS